MTAAEILGAVLAGGESRRFGRDKAAEVVAGRSLVERAAETLNEVFDEVVIVSAREPTTTEWPQVPDVRTGMGPLAGIEAALLHAEHLGLDGAFVLACDLPLVNASVVRSVLKATGESVACAPLRRATEVIEPLCGVYRLQCLQRVSDSLDRGRLSVRGLFHSVAGVTTPLPGEVFLNVNRPEDLARWAQSVRMRAGLVHVRLGQDAR